MKINRLDEKAVTSVTKANRLTRLSIDELREVVGSSCYYIMRSPEECGGPVDGCLLIYWVPTECVA